MRNIGSYDAKTNLSRLLDDVARGETIVITKHGVPVAVLAPPPEMQRPDVGAVIAELREFRKTLKLDAGLPVRDMIKEGRM